MPPADNKNRTMTVGIRSPFLMLRFVVETPQGRKKLRFGYDGHNSSYGRRTIVEIYPSYGRRTVDFAICDWGIREVKM